MARFTLPQSDPDTEHFVLHYNAYREAFSAHNIVEQHYFNFIISVFIIIGFLGLWACLALQMSPFLFLAMFFVLLAIPTFLDIASPTHLELTREGMRFLWSNPIWYHMGPLVYWQSIKRAELNIDSSGNNHSKYFELSIDTASEQTTSNLSLTFLPIIKSYGHNEVTLKLLEKGFFQTADRAQFIRSLQKFVPAEAVSAQLLAFMVFDKVPTYTALWLDEFGHHKRDDSLMVPDGTHLANGQYQVINRLGAGGQSIVYEAQRVSVVTIEPAKEAATEPATEPVVETTADSPADASPHPTFQILSEGRSANLQKCVLKEFVLPSRGGYEINKRALENVQREYALLRSIDNQDIVKAFDLFVEGNRAYLVLERVFGTNMRTLVLQNDLKKENVVPLAIQMCEILSYLHSRVPPIIHRDFTPDNLLLTDEKRVKLIDFNIAFTLESNNTKTVAGKHAYISPEQFRGKPTVQSDIYSFGATLFFLLMGKDPEPITKSVPDCDAQLAEIIGRCTEPVETERVQNIEQVKQDLLKCDQKY